MRAALRLASLALAVVASYPALAGVRIRSLAELPMRWRDEDDAEMTLARWAGPPIVLAMTYTSCPRTCPLVTIPTLRRLEGRLRDRATPAEFVVVTLDPTTDTPAVLRRYKAEQGLTSPHWHFLTGRLDDVRSVARALGLGVMRMDDHLLHSVSIVLFGADGQVEHGPGGGTDDGGTDLRVHLHATPPDSDRSSEPML